MHMGYARTAAERAPGPMVRPRRPAAAGKWRLKLRSGKDAGGGNPDFPPRRILVPGSGTGRRLRNWRGLRGRNGLRCKCSTWQRWNLTRAINDDALSGNHHARGVLNSAVATAAVTGNSVAHVPTVVAWHPVVSGHAGITGNTGASAVSAVGGDGLGINGCAAATRIGRGAGTGVGLADVARSTAITCEQTTT